MIKPSKILVDTNAPNIEIEATVDVSAPDALQVQGKYVVYSAQPAANEAWVIKAMACFAWARQNVGLSSEYVARIPSAKGDGFFLFEPQVSGAAAFGLTRTNLAAWTTAAGATAADRKTSSGITLLSDQPFDAAHIAEGNGNRRFIVPPGQQLNVLFSLVPDAIANPLPGRFAVGGTSPLPDYLQRVDYVGVIMVGTKLSKTYYDSLAKQQEAWNKAK